MKVKNPIFPMLLTALLLSTVLHAAETGRGGYAGNFLRMGLCARSMAMGGGSVAVTDDGSVAYYNPGGLVFLEGKWVTASLNTMALDRAVYYVGYAQSLGGKNPKNDKKGLLKGGLSVGWLSAGVQGIDARNFNGEDIGTLSFEEHCFYFSFALNPAPFLAFGFNGKLLYSQFPDLADDGSALGSTGLGFDIGVIVRPIQSLRIGVTIRDMHARYTWDSQEIYEKGTQTIDHFPQVYRAGIAWYGLNSRLILTADIEQVKKCPAVYMAGLEYRVYDGICLRSGLKSGDLTFGGGYRTNVFSKSTRIDYAYAPDSVAPRGNHIFTWSFIF